MAVKGRAMTSTMILSIQDQRLRDLGRRVLGRSWGGVEELGELRHCGEREGLGASVMVLNSCK